MNVQTLPVSFDPYVRQGWYLVPIPPGSKGPINSGWNRIENCVTDPNKIPAGYGVGLAHAYSGTCALDIDDGFLSGVALSEVGIDLQALLNAPDAVQIISGNAGHAKLLYRLPMGMALASKKISREGRVVYELRNATSAGTTTQCVLPPSIHPMTLRPYTWGGLGHWERLPMIPDALLHHWQGLIAKDTERTISTTAVDASWEEIRSALYAINPSTSRDDWVSVGMALHYAGSASGQLDQACALWDEWSSQSVEKYKGPRDILACWRSFKADPSGIRLGTLFKLAYNAGWVRPTVDVTGMFSNAAPDSPSSVVDLLTMRIKPPVVPLELFPPLLAEYADQIGTMRGCDPLIPLWAGIVAASAAIDSRVRLEVLNDFKVPPVLWVMTIGDPSDKKTPGSEPMFDPLISLELEDKDRHKASHLMWQAKEAAHAAAKKALFEHVANATNQLANTAIPTVPDLPPEPKPLRLIINDSTSQKVIHIAQGNPQGMVLYLDEMAHWIHKINDPKSGDDRGCWIAGYQSRPYTMDRITAGTISAEMFSLSIYGNIQPTILSEQLSRMSADGLLQRFIPIHLRGNRTRKPVSVPTFMTRRGDYEALIRRLRAIDHRSTYYLSQDAADAYSAFQDWYLTLRVEERIIDAPSVYMTALGKIEGTCARLAFILHLIEAPDSQAISGDLMRRACQITTEFIVPALRYTFGNQDDPDNIDRWLVNYLITRPELDITLREIKHSGRSRYKVQSWQFEQDVLTTMDYLQRANWVCMVDSIPNKGAYRWAINPDVFKLYADQRQAAVEAHISVRRKMMDKMGIDTEDPRRRAMGL